MIMVFQFPLKFKIPSNEVAKIWIGSRTNVLMILSIYWLNLYNSIVDMARNKGLIPSAPAEISIQRKQIKTIIESLLPACTEPDPITGEPFKAQAIIANPPAYG